MLYRYKGVNAQGEVVEGGIEADAAPDAVARLQDAGLLPIRVQPATSGRQPLPWRRGGGAPQREIDAFTHELAILLAAGLPLDRALRTLSDLADDARLKRLIARLEEGVRAGASLSSALEAQEGVFSPLYVSMVRAGEAGGATDQALARLAEHLERARALRESVLSALIYPLILVAVAGVSVLILLMYVVPQFTQLFEDMGGALPLPTRVVIGTGELVQGYWWTVALGVLALLAYVRHQRARPVRRLRWDALLLRVPLLGALAVKTEVARFSRTLGTLLGNGVPLLSALAIARDTLANLAVAQAVDTAGAELAQGRGLSGPLADTGVFPRIAVQMIQVGEESGRLEEMLLRVADVYDREVRRAIQRLLALLEPALIVGLGIIIAAIVLSLLTAVLGMNQLL
jgi:general secretion pathway protein F